MKYVMHHEAQVSSWLISFRVKIMVGADYNTLRRTIPTAKSQFQKNVREKKVQDICGLLNFLI